MKFEEACLLVEKYENVKIKQVCLQELVKQLML